MLEPDQFERKGVCPHCGDRVEVATSVERGDPTPPKGGDVTICFACGELALFCDDASLRKPTEEEWLVLMNDIDIVRLRFAWRAAKLGL